MAYSSKDVWEKDLRKYIRSNFNSGWRVIGENSGRTKLTYSYPNDGRRASNTLPIEWKKIMGKR